ncbi:hypothetical protein V2J09_011373 [Rumex salicifolius]
MMKAFKSSSFLFLAFILFISIFSSVYVKSINLPAGDVDLLEFPLNLEYLEAEFFSWGALGYGLDVIEPGLAQGGPPPTGASIAKLDPFTRDVIMQFAYQEVGHLKAIKNAVKGFPRPRLDLRAAQFANVMNQAIGRTLQPPFNPYANSINYLIASYLIPYVGLTGYVGANPMLQDSASKRVLVAGLLAVESGQDAVIRTILYERAKETVKPYGITVAEFTNKISILRNNLGKMGVKDEGLVVPYTFGAEMKVTGNVLAGNNYSIGYDRTPQEVLRVVYGTGNESVPGGFYPDGALGNIARIRFNLSLSVNIGKYAYSHDNLATEIFIGKVVGIDNRSWMYDRRLTDGSGWKNEFINGVEIFIEFATLQVHLMDGSKIKYPCSKCKNERLQEIDDVRVHLYTKGFVDTYYWWTAHGELSFVSVSNQNNINIFGIGIDLFDNSNPAQRMVFDAPDSSFLPPPWFDHNSSINDQPSISHVEILAVVSSFMELKTKYNMSQARNNALLQKKKLNRELGLPQQKIPMCPKGRLLFWKDDANATECKFCNSPRYKPYLSQKEKQIPN